VSVRAFGHTVNNSTVVAMLLMVIGDISLQCFDTVGWPTGRASGL